MAGVCDHARVTIGANRIRGYLAAATLVLCSLGVTVWVAVKGGSAQPLDGVTSAFLAVLSGLFQILGATAAARAGKVDPGHARSAVTRLTRIGLRAQQAEQWANMTKDSGSTVKSREALGQIGLLLSYVQEDASDMIDEWRHFHPGELGKIRSVELVSPDRSAEVRRG
ncbi:hypothetical protein [Micromonospora palythoicola]|uniref:hypothetical protein n=1 Tax=Micromonospora palythoicola TaxID=3120507 RepID=UPI002FCE03DE